MNQIEEIRNNKIKELIDSDEIILSDYDLQLLMYDANDREDNGTYYDDIWFKIFRNIATKNNEKFNVMNSAKQKDNVYKVDSLYLNDSELLLLELGETEEEVKENINKYYTILENSKGTIGIKLDKNEIKHLLNIIKNCKPSKEDNDNYYENISSKFNTRIGYFHK